MRRKGVPDDAVTIRLGIIVFTLIDAKERKKERKCKYSESLSGLTDPSVFPDPPPSARAEGAVLG